jgi:hypothetical protein
VKTSAQNSIAPGQNELFYQESAIAQPGTDEVSVFPEVKNMLQNPLLDVQ